MSGQAQEQDAAGKGLWFRIARASLGRPECRRPARRHPGGGDNGFLRRFIGAERGSIAIIFAASLVPATGMIGFSVDYGRALTTRTKLQSALDSAVLAGGREFQVTGSESAAETAAAEHFEGALPDDVAAELTLNEADGGQSAIEMRAQVVVPTSFLGVLGTDTITVSASAASGLAMGGSDKDLEVSLMLDITGSMSGQKIVDLKTAAKDLIEIIVPEVAGEHVARVALVPFSAAVNPGSYLATVRGPNSSGGPACPANSTGGWYSKQCYVSTNGSNRRADRTGCVSERTGPEAFTDASPTASNGRVNAAYGATCPSATVIPLTDDKDALAAAIDAYAAGGWTAGQIGTAWAWYTLSPEWSDVWPAANAPAAYGDSNVMKVAVLMTDGEYNTEYTNFVRAADQDDHPVAPNGTSDAQARTLCAEMKARGITVYTVGFQLEDANAIETMTQCASGDGHAFLASDGSQLQMAFRQIAFQLAQLRLTQ